MIHFSNSAYNILFLIACLTMQGKCFFREVLNTPHLILDPSQKKTKHILLFTCTVKWDIKNYLFFFSIKGLTTFGPTKSVVRI